MKAPKLLLSLMLIVAILSSPIFAKLIDAHTADARPRSFDAHIMSTQTQDIFFSDMYFGYSLDETSDDQIHIFSNRCQVECYAKSLSDQIPGMKNFIDDFFSVYDDNFFCQYKLVIALVDRGSGMLRFELDSVESSDNILDIRINRIIQPILTHDMRQWVMVLPVANSHQFDSVSLTLSDIILDKMPSR